MGTAQMQNVNVMRKETNELKQDNVTTGNKLKTAALLQ